MPQTFAKVLARGLEIALNQVKRSVNFCYVSYFLPKT
jgi:hypothetical protein